MNVLIAGARSNCGHGLWARDCARPVRGSRDCGRHKSSENMKAARLFEHGGPDVLTYIDVPIPQVSADMIDS